MKQLIGFFLLLALGQTAQAADIEAGRQLASTVCAACHGANGVSVNDNIPNLAGQRAGYIEARLRGFQMRARQGAATAGPAASMDAIAPQLRNEDIANVAAYFATQPGAAAGAKSAFLPNLTKTEVSFPENYAASFTRYHTMNFPATRQVRYFYANPPAVAAAKAGRPLPDGSVLLVVVHAAKLDAEGKPQLGADGFFVADRLLFYTAMASGEGWGRDFPEMLRNGNWNYAVFTAERQMRANVHQADCLACHKPLDKVSYTFTLKQLADAK